MEIKGGHQNKLRVCIVEAIGTGLLLFSINWGSAGTVVVKDQDGLNTPVVYGAFSTASTLFACIYMFGSVSGAHFNPAITIAVLIKEGEKNLIANIIFAFQIVISQTIGGTIGCLLSLLGNSYKQRVLWPNIALLCPPTLETITKNQVTCNPGNRTGQVQFTEWIGTFLFVTGVLCIGYHRGTKYDLINAQCISFLLYGILKLTQGISGSCINPAVGLVQSIFQFIVTQLNMNERKDPVTLLSMWVYVSGPLMGGVTAGLASRAISLLYQNSIQIVGNVDSQEELFDSDDQKIHQYGLPITSINEEESKNYDKF